MEFLKDILGESLFNQVKEKVQDKKISLVNVSDGSYIPRRKFNKLLNQNRTQKKQLEQQSINEKCFIARYEKKLNYLFKELAITRALAEKGAINHNIVRMLLNEKKIICDKEKVVGLHEQLDALVNSEPYLFRT